ncbi:MAG: prepilin-type N-terminal cleavage/methylation domain-containing protein [Clostridia bacterium]|nr:prepilin-type N-terminal cleavage/methylation domain-containing protein [Clostridia bacterium]
MKRTNKKGFTIVELVIVIAVIGILAAVLIPTISNVIQKAKDAAYLQNRTNKQTEGVIEKIDNPNYMTWEDFEDKLAEALTKANDSTAEKIQAAVGEAIKNARFDEPGITESQIRDIIERTLEGQLTDAQVKAIVEKAVEGKGVSAEDVNRIVNKAISNLPKKVGVTKDEMTAAIKSAVQNIATGLSASEVEEAINTALANFDNDGISDDQLAGIVDKVAAQIEINKIKNKDIQKAIDASGVRNVTETENLVLDGFSADVTYVFNVEENGSAPELGDENEIWLVDYEVTFNRAIVGGSVYLLGAYDWYQNGTPVPLPACDPATSDPTQNPPVLSDLAAGRMVRLMKECITPLYFENNYLFTYNDVVTYVKEFKCGIKNLSPDNTGAKLNVKLCLYRCVKVEAGTVGAFTNDNGETYFKETGEVVECTSITYTLEYNEVTEPSGD